jgi:Domain of unknown function (DUF4214)
MASINTYNDDSSSSSTGGSTVIMATASASGDASMITGVNSFDTTVPGSISTATINVASDGVNIETLTEIVPVNINSQSIDFQDGVIPIQWLYEAESILKKSPSTLTALGDLYIGYFNRAPDALGLVAWAAGVSQGESLQTIAESFAKSSEFFTNYPNVGAQASDSDLISFISTVYINILDRQPDSGGLAYWLGLMKSEDISPGVLITSIINAVHGENGTPDANFLAGKENVALHFAVTDGLTNGAQASAVMNQFNTIYSIHGLSEAINSANAMADSYAANRATTPELVVHLVGVPGV